MKTPSASATAEAEVRSVPDNSHQLAPDDRKTPISADTEVKRDFEIRIRITVTGSHQPTVKVYRQDLALEENANI